MIAESCRVAVSRIDEDEFVFVSDFDAAAADDSCADLDEVVVLDAPAVACVEPCDDEEDAALFELRVGDAGFAEEFCSAHFEPRAIGGVVGDAHGVALAVSDSDGDLAVGWCFRCSGWLRRR